MSLTRYEQAAQLLHEAHERREPFRPLPRELAPRTGEAAYEIQDEFVALRAEVRGAAAGRSSASCTAISNSTMRRR